MSNLIKILISLPLKNRILFVIAVILIKAVRYKHEISMIKDAPNQSIQFVCYNRKFVITIRYY